MSSSFTAAEWRRLGCRTKVLGEAWLKSNIAASDFVEVEYMKTFKTIRHEFAKYDSEMETFAQKFQEKIEEKKIEEKKIEEKRIEEKKIEERQTIKRKEIDDEKHRSVVVEVTAEQRQTVIKEEINKKIKGLSQKFPIAYPRVDPSTLEKLKRIAVTFTEALERIEIRGNDQELRMLHHEKTVIEISLRNLHESLKAVERIGVANLNVPSTFSKVSSSFGLQ